MRAVDLFAGCGGLSKGFEDAGIEIAAAYENWEPAFTCYQNNFKHPVFNIDLSDIQTAILHIAQWQPDLIIGGPPCQDFSHAGKRSEGKRADLTEAFAKIITNIRPTWFVMENVDRAVNSKAYSVARAIFKKTGYGLNERILNASFCGVPQRRKRFFCIGQLNSTDEFLNSEIDNHVTEKQLTIREFLGDEFNLEYYYRHPRNYNRRGIFSVDEPAPTVRGVNRPVPKGYLGHPGDPTPVTNKLRPLTTLERARIQTFPPTYKWTGSKTDSEQMIGNAVPIKLAEFIARRIIAYHKQISLKRKTSSNERQTVCKVVRR